MNRLILIGAMRVELIFITYEHLVEFDNIIHKGVSLHLSNFYLCLLKSQDRLLLLTIKYLVHSIYINPWSYFSRDWIPLALLIYNEMRNGSGEFTP